MITLRSKDILGKQSFHIAETILLDDKVTFEHSHEFCELFLITEGSILHQINGTEMFLPHYSLCLVTSEDVHHFKKERCKSAHFVNIAFSVALFQQAVQSYAGFAQSYAEQLPAGKAVQLPAGLAQGLLSKISFLTRDDIMHFHVDNECMVFGIVVDALCYLQTHHSCEPSVPTWLSDACEAMRRDQNYVWGLPRFIALAGKSQEHLTRSMKRFYNTTPSAYINDIRLSEAAFRLRTTKDTVLDILFDCGFNNVSYFNQLFKQVLGVAPTKYRQLNQSVINPI